jgi:hypothetical protein
VLYIRLDCEFARYQFWFALRLSGQAGSRNTKASQVDVIHANLVSFNPEEHCVIVTRCSWKADDLSPSD